MSLHLLIVARHDPPEDEFEDAAGQTQATETFKVLRCNSPSELDGAIRGAVAESYLKVGRLDIYGHGKPGIQYLGDEILVDLPKCGNFAMTVSKYLTPDADVRLLGCTTAEGADGQNLLLELHRKLGENRVVFGTIVNCEAEVDFGPEGLLVEVEDEYLFSSTEAVTRKAPGQTARQEEICKWVAETTRS